MGDVDGTIVYTLIATAGTPPAVVAKLNAALNAAVSTPEAKEDLRSAASSPWAARREELAKWTTEQAPIWVPVLKAAGIKPE